MAEESKQNNSLPIGELLIALGLVGKNDLEQAKRISKDTGLPIGRVLIMSGYLEELHLQIVLEAQVHLREGKLTLEKAKEAIDLACKESTSFGAAALKLGFALDNKTRIGELLVAAEFITDQQLQLGLETSATSFLPIGRTLVLAGVLSEELLTTAINAQRLLREQKISREQALEGMRAAKARAPVAAPAGKQRHFYKLPARKTIRMGELLIGSGIISEPQLLSAIEIGLVNGLSLGQVLIEMRLVKPETLEAALDLQKLLVQDQIRLDEATKVLFRICQENITLAHALKTTVDLTQPNENRSLLQFLKLNHHISEEAVAKLVEFVLQDSQITAKTLVKAKILEEDFVNKAARCQQLWERDTISLEHACIILNHAHTNQLTVDEALQELSWGQQPKEPVVAKSSTDSMGANWDEQSRIVEVQLKEQNFQSALESLYRLLQIAEQLPGQPNEIFEVLEKIAEVHSLLEENQKAAHFWKKALEIKVRRFGDRSYNLASTLNNLARVSYFNKNFDDAELHSRHYIGVLTETLGSEHPNVGAASHNLATIYHIQKKYSEAESAYSKAMTVCQKSLGMNHPATVKILQDYSKLLRETHREQEAQHFDSCAVGLVSGTWKALLLDPDELLGE